MNNRKTLFIELLLDFDGTLTQASNGELFFTDFLKSLQSYPQTFYTNPLKPVNDY